MGIFLDPGNGAFKTSVDSKIYVDKTGIIAEAFRKVDNCQYAGGILQQRLRLRGNVFGL